MTGHRGRKYVVGIDPAAERDNFAMVVLEVWPNHYRVVYCWSVNKKEFNKRKKAGYCISDDYYTYCCERIREITTLFSPVRIEMDSQGGGSPIAEMLRNKKLIDTDSGEFPIYEVIDPDDPRDTDGEIDGRHILHLQSQTNEWNAASNVFLHKSLEVMRLLFPAFDVVRMQAALLAEKASGIVYDTFEEALMNVEELKNELCTIQMTATATNKEKFDTPNVVQAGSLEGRERKGRLKKDRYSALMFAHRYAYDNDTCPTVAVDYDDVAGNIRKVEAPAGEGMYRGPGASRMKNAGDWARGGDAHGGVKKGKRV
jgi:hypothetical protein